MPDVLESVSSSGRFHFDYATSWFITNEEKNVIVLRYVDRGELVAQCNIFAPWRMCKNSSL